MSMFDPTQFTDYTVTDANDTKLVPIPVGEYLATVDKIDFRQWQKKDDPTVNGITLDVTWKLEDENLKQQLGREKITVRQGVMIDTTEAGGLDMGKGKNVGLGRIREATGLNTPGQPFSPSMLTGRMAKVVVSHRPDERNPGDVFSEVKAVTKAS